MKKLIFLMVLVLTWTISISQKLCDTTKISKTKLVVCEVDRIKKIDLDSMAREFSGIKNEIHYVVVKKDGVIQKHTMILTANKKFFGDRVAITNIMAQNKSNCVIINLNEDFSTEIVKYKDAVRQGSYSHYYFPFLLKETGKYKSNLKNGRWMYWDSLGRLIEIKYFREGEEKKAFEGKKLKSLKIFRLGIILEAGTQHVNCNGINDVLREYSPLSHRFEPGNILLKYGLQMGNPGSLTWSVFYKSLINKTVTDFLLSGDSYGFAFNYNLLRSKNFNFIFGSGLDFPSFNFYKAVNRNPPFTDPVLSNQYIRNSNNIALDFNLTVSPRRLRFKRKTSLDYHNYLGVRLGYALPVKTGNYHNQNNVELNLTEPLFYLNGIHFSIFFMPLLF